MSYTALDSMREKLNKEYPGAEMGPISPKETKINPGEGADLITAARHFMNELCQNLRFDLEKTKTEEQTGKYLGRSSKDGQIPYNMQRDIDRLSFERAIERFYESGSQEDAFDVYFLNTCTEYVFCQE